MFGADGFVPRGFCGSWIQEFKYVYAVSQLSISLAYAVIPLALLMSRFQWKVVSESRPVRCWFAAFILACGLGHLEGALAFVWPAYHLFAVWHFMTAIISWGTIVVIVGEAVTAKQKQP